MGSQGPSQSGSSTTSHPMGPPWLMKYFHNIGNDYMSGMQNLPNITDLYSGVPLLGTAGLNDQQNQDIQGFQNNIGLNSAENISQQGLENFVGGGPGTPSAATLAQMKEFNDLQSPLIQSQAALMGLGNSGASLSALAQGQEQAAVPFLQQDQANQLSAATQLGQMGMGEAGQIQTQLQNALTAAGIPQQLQQQILQNQFNQSQQGWNFAQGIQTGGATQFPSLIGGGSTTSNSSSSQPKF